jgi:hypothetical protein
MGQTSGYAIIAFRFIGKEHTGKKSWKIAKILKNGACGEKLGYLNQRFSYLYSLMSLDVIHMDVIDIRRNVFLADSFGS